MYDVYMYISDCAPPFEIPGSAPGSSPVQSPGFVKAPTETYYGCPQCGHKKVDKLDDIKNFI